MPTFSFTRDGFGRLTGMTESDNGVAWVQNAQYDYAGRLSGKQFAVSTSTNANGVTTAVMLSEARGYGS